MKQNAIIENIPLLTHFCSRLVKTYYNGKLILKLFSKEMFSSLIRTILVEELNRFMTTLV